MQSLYMDYTTGELARQEEITLKDGKRDWNGKKRLGMILGNIVKRYDEERGNKIIACGRNLVFMRQADGGLHLRSADFCRERMCPVCQWRRSLRLAVQCNRIYAALTEKGYEHVFVTLTVRNCKVSELAETADKLYKDVRAWVKSKKFMRVFHGGYRAFEITYNKDADTYHPHMHFLLTCDADYFRKDNPNYISHADLVAWWREVAGLNYDPSVRIQAIKPKPGQTMTAAAVEMCKYPTKVAEAFAVEDVEKRTEVIQTLDYALRGRRLVSFFGLPQKVRKELELKDIEDGDLVAVDDQTATAAEDVDRIVYVWRSGYYIPTNYTQVSN